MINVQLIAQYGWADTMAAVLIIQMNAIHNPLFHWISYVK